jgi:hypothetical protein
MNKREQRARRERAIAEMRAFVQSNIRKDRIAETQTEVNRLAQRMDTDGIRALMDTERGRELADFNSGRSNAQVSAERTGRSPAASRNSYWQESILEALADGQYALTREILNRLGETKPTPARRVTVSRALARLKAKELIEAGILNDQTLQGNGYLWRLKK